MQREESMDKIFKFIFVMTIFISPFIVAMNNVGKPLFFLDKFS